MAGLEEDIRESADEMIEHPRCAILPSPEKLNVSTRSPGQDETNTRADFADVYEWLKLNYLNTGFYEDASREIDPNRQLEEGRYKSFIQFAFSNAFEPIRNTYHPDKEEMVLLYYTGHGSEHQPGKSSSPDLTKVSLTDDRIEEYSNAERRFLTQNRGVKGGELCLHDVGYCDLQGLLTPWIAAVTNPPTKKNKHLVVIADSCYSGELVNDLKELARRDGPWKKNGCTVTVQSASSRNEVTFGGYFTPCFVHFNKPENHDSLRELVRQWKDKSKEEKDAFFQRHSCDRLPSPQVATTGSFSKDGPVMKLNIQNSTLFLFHDAQFFKFCFLSLPANVRHEVEAFRSDEARTNLLKERSSWMTSYIRASDPEQTS